MVLVWEEDDIIRLLKISEDNLEFAHKQCQVGNFSSSRFLEIRILMFFLLNSTSKCRNRETAMLSISG